MPTARITTLWQDIENKRMTIPIYFDTGDVSTVALAQTAFSAYETLLHAMSGAAIVGAEVCFGLNVAGTENPDPGYYLNSGAWAGFENSDTVGDGLYIPSILNSKVVGGVLDSSDADVAAFISEATGNGTAPPLSSRGSAALWAAFVRGYQTTRKLRR